MNTSLYRDICQCCLPTPLLKFGKGGLNKPGFRLFSLSSNLDAIVWTSQNRASSRYGGRTRKNSEGERRILLLDVKEIRFGQRTEKFKKNNRPDLKSLSFSLIYNDPKNPNETLDLVCKDDKEFQMWTGVLIALIDKKIPDDQMEYLRGKAAEFVAEHRDKANADADKDEASCDVYGFGWGEWGQNASDSNTLATPRLIETLLGKGITQVACGYGHTLVVTESNECYQYGGMVGTHLDQDSNAPTLVKMTQKTELVSVACGSFHSVALTVSGHVVTWGANVHGQLGHGDKIDRREPTVVEELMSNAQGLELTIFQVAASANSTAALGDDGNVYTWGSGENGVLGHNDLEDRVVPLPIKDLSGSEIVRIAAGDFHMVACTDTDTFSWGWNGCGQLGLGHEEDLHRPHVIDTLRGTKIVSISCGAAHTVGVGVGAHGTKGIVYSWGSNSNGQLGQGKKKKVLKPTDISGLPSIREAACGSLHTVLLSDDYTLYSTGLNKYGQLGHGSTDEIDSFTLIEALREKKPRKVVCGGQHTAVLTLREWVADEEAKECMSCKAAFTFTNRKHHCRNCLGIFCNSCSSKRFALLSTGSTKPVRVCNNCFNKLGGR